MTFFSELTVDLNNNAFFLSGIYGGIMAILKDSPNPSRTYRPCNDPLDEYARELSREKDNQ
jgi:hypothetical protein